MKIPWGICYRQVITLIITISKISCNVHHFFVSFNFVIGTFRFTIMRHPSSFFKKMVDSSLTRSIKKIE